MAEFCSVCGAGRGPTYRCNRGLCGLPRTLTAQIRVGDQIVEREAEIPPRVHRARIEAALLKEANEDHC